MLLYANRTTSPGLQFRLHGQLAVPDLQVDVCFVLFVFFLFTFLYFVFFFCLFVHLFVCLFVCSLVCFFVCVSCRCSQSVSYPPSSAGGRLWAAHGSGLLLQHLWWQTRPDGNLYLQSSAPIFHLLCHIHHHVESWGDDDNNDHHHICLMVSHIRHYHHPCFISQKEYPKLQFQIFDFTMILTIIIIIIILITILLIIFE